MAQRSVFLLEVTHLWNMQASHSTGLPCFSHSVCARVCACVDFLPSFTLHSKLDMRCIRNWGHLKWAELLLAFCKVFFFFLTFFFFSFSVISLTFECPQEHTATRGYRRVFGYFMHVFHQRVA